MSVVWAIGIGAGEPCADNAERHYFTTRLPFPS